METKRCYKCHQHKTKTEFYKNNAKKDKLTDSCKLCEKQRVKNYSKYNNEIVKQKNKARNRTLQGQYNALKRDAKRRKKELTISLEEYSKIRSSKCHYCNNELPITSSGLDRKDNNIGYTLENVVPCCSYCNRMKNAYISYEEMLLIWSNRKQGK